MLRPQITECGWTECVVCEDFMATLEEHTPPLETALGRYIRRGRDGTHAKRGRKKGLTNLLLQAAKMKCSSGPAFHSAQKLLRNVIKKVWTIAQPAAAWLISLNTFWGRRRRSSTRLVLIRRRKWFLMAHSDKHQFCSLFVTKVGSFATLQMVCEKLAVLMLNQRFWK